MLRIHAEEYVELGKSLHDFTAVLYHVPEQDGSVIIPAMDDELKADLRRFVAEVSKRCSALGLQSSAYLFGMAHANPPRTDRELHILELALEAELHSNLFLFVPTQRSAQYEKDDALTDPAKLAFPRAAAELREAGNAYAVGLYTACVFHSMRALEHGLGALAEDVGKTFDVQMWQNIINEIGGAIVALGQTLPKGQAKSDRLRFLSEAAAEFTYFKDGWRNYVSHGKTPYGEQQALTVMSHTRDFLERLSTNLREGVGDLV